MKRYGRGHHPRRRKEAALGSPESWGYSPLEKHIAGDVIRALRKIGCEASSTQQTRASRQTVVRGAAAAAGCGVMRLLLASAALNFQLKATTWRDRRSRN